MYWLRLGFVKPQLAILSANLIEMLTALGLPLIETPIGPKGVLETEPEIEGLRDR